MENNEKLLSAIFNVGRLIREKIYTSNCLADFTHSEIEILKLVHGSKGLTMKSIAGHLHIKPSSATPLIEGLAKKGNIKRVQKKDDRRIVYVELTAKGLKSLQKNHKNIHKTMGKIFGKLNASEKNNLINIFNKIHAENK